MWSWKPAETKRQGETIYAQNKTATDLTQFKTIQVQAAVPERVKEGVGREQGTCSQPNPSILSRIRSNHILTSDSKKLSLINFRSHISSHILSESGGPECSKWTFLWRKCPRLSTEASVEGWLGRSRVYFFEKQDLWGAHYLEQRAAWAEWAEILSRILPGEDCSLTKV